MARRGSPVLVECLGAICSRCSPPYLLSRRTTGQPGCRHLAHPVDGDGLFLRVALLRVGQADQRRAGRVQRRRLHGHRLLQLNRVGLARRIANAFTDTEAPKQSVTEQVERGFGGSLENFVFRTGSVSSGCNHYVGVSWGSARKFQETFKKMSFCKAALDEFAAGKVRC